MKMKKVLNNTGKTIEYLATLPKIYMVGHWYRYGVWEFTLAGWEKDGPEMIPLVYQYDDGNGEHDLYFLRDIRYTTTGGVILWTMEEGVAKLIAKRLNKDED